MADLYIPIPANITQFPDPFFVSLLSIVLGQSQYFREKPMNEFVHTPTWKQFLDFELSNITSPEITPNQKEAIMLIYNAAFGNGTSAEEAAKMVDGLPHPNVFCKLLAAHATVIALAVLFVGTRFFARLRVLSSPKKEDWLILAALICFLTSSVISFIGVTTTYKHIYDVSGIILTKWFRMGVIVFYPLMIGMCLVKLSFLEMYRGIAPSKRFITVCYATASFIIIGSIAFLIVLSVICYPTHTAWTDPLNLKCNHRRLNLNTALSVFYVVTDFIILALPMTIVRKLKLPLKTKIGVIVMFTLGASACIFSILRTVSSSVTNVDFTWHAIPTLIYAMLEMYIGIICACIPPLKNLFVTSASKFKKRISAHGTYGSARRPSNTRIAVSKRGILKNNSPHNGSGHVGVVDNGIGGNVILGGMFERELAEVGLESKPGNESSELDDIKEEAKASVKPKPAATKPVRYEAYDEDALVIGGDLEDSYRRIHRALDAGFSFGASSMRDLEKGSR